MVQEIWRDLQIEPSLPAAKSLVSGMEASIFQAAFEPYFTEGRPDEIDLKQVEAFGRENSLTEL